MNDVEQSRAAIERYCEVWSELDLDGILDCYADEFTLHYFGDNPHRGDHVGKDASVAALIEVSAKAPRKLVAIDEIMVGAGTAVLVVREEISGDDEVHEIRRVLRFRTGGGKLLECWLYEEDQAIVDRAWA